MNTSTLDISNLPVHIQKWLTSISPDELYHYMHVCYSISQSKKPEIIQSVKAGAEGENYTYSMLSKKFKVIQNTKDKYAGDFIVLVNNYRIMIEVKNYTNTVPKKEITKFYRDMSCKTVDAALFISLKSKIVNMKQNISLGEKNGKPVIFVCNDSEDSIVGSINLLTTLLDHNAKMSKYVEDTHKYREQIDKFITSIEQFTVNRMHFLDDIRQINNILYRNYENMLKTEIELKQFIEQTEEAALQISDQSFVENITGDYKYIVSNIVNKLDTISSTWNVSEKFAIHVNTNVKIDLKRILTISIEIDESLTDIVSKLLMIDGVKISNKTISIIINHKVEKYIYSVIDQIVEKYNSSL